MEPEPVIEPEPVEDITEYDRSMFMTETPIELIDNEFVAVETEPESVAVEPEPVVEPEPIAVEPENVEPDMVKPETGIEVANVTEPDSYENTAVLVPAKPNPPGPAVSEIGGSGALKKPEKQDALITSDSIYEGEDRIMEKYNYAGSEVSSEIYDRESEEIPEPEVIEEPESVIEPEITEEPEVIEPETNIYFDDEKEDENAFTDEPEVFIIPIIDVDEEEPYEEQENETDIEPVVEPVMVPVEKKELAIRTATETENQKNTVVAETITESQQIVAPVQNTDIKTIKAGELVKGCYIQIATYSKLSNVKDVVAEYGTRYPIKVVEMTSGGWQVLVGELTESEYTVVLERFRMYGFKDAFLKRIN